MYKHVRLTCVFNKLIMMMIRVGLCYAKASVLAWL